VEVVLEAALYIGHIVQGNTSLGTYFETAWNSRCTDFYIVQIVGKYMQVQCNFVLCRKVCQMVPWRNFKCLISILHNFLQGSWRWGIFCDLRLFLKLYAQFSIYEYLMHCFVCQRAWIWASLESGRLYSQKF